MNIEVASEVIAKRKQAESLLTIFLSDFKAVIPLTYIFWKQHKLGQKVYVLQIMFSMLIRKTQKKSHKD